MRVSVTELASWRRCRRMWNYASFNRMSLEPIVPQRALQFGTLWHKALEQWSLNDSLTLAEHFLLISDEHLTKLREDYKAQIGCYPSPGELEDTYINIELGQAMARNYQKRYHTPLPDGFVLVQPEQTIVVPIPDTPHELEGTLDGIARDKHGSYYVLEHKTFDKHPPESVLQTSDQFLGYLYILYRLVSPAHRVNGILYNGAWKRATPPRGRVFDDLFLRMPLNRSIEEIKEYEVQLAQQVTEMANDPPIYINRDRRGCFDCNFTRLCISQSRNEDTTPILKHFYKPRETKTMENES